MKSLFRNMDFLKGLILVCILASAVLGAWDYLLQGQLEKARKAFRDAKADVVEIHALLKQIPALYKAQEELSQQGSDPGVYFENQLTNFGGIPLQSYVLQDIKRTEVTVSTKKGSQKARDKVLTIDFRGRSGSKERLYLPRENLFKALWACERNSKSWRLRDLSIRSKDDVERKGRREDGYPAEIADEWFIEKLSFASREPAGR
jgi:hypothetical protein